MPQRDSYAAVDFGMASRLAGFLWVLTGLGEIAMVLLALLTGGPSPSDDPVRIVLAAVLVGGALAVGVNLARNGRALGPRALLVHPSAGAAQVLALRLALGDGLGLLELLVAWIVFVAALHPGRIVVAFAIVSQAAATAASLLAHGDVRGILDHVLLWSGLSFLAFLLLRGVRTQRADLRRRVQDADRLARVDALTGLANRRALDDALEREAARAGRGNTELAIVVADIDAFKAVNDTAGHEAGDACLQGVAGVLRRELRRPDLAFRWGGDEFVLLLPDANESGAEGVANRICLATAEHVHRPDGSPLGLSWGSATLEPGLSARDALAAADGALVASKRRRANAPARTRVRD